MALTKIQEFKDLSLEEIETKIVKLKKEVFNLKIKQSTKQTVKSHIFKHKKHTLAQLLTLENQKIN